MARKSERYDTTFIAVRNLVARADPDGLFSAGAPDDEYDDLVSSLVIEVLGERDLTTAPLSLHRDEWHGQVSRTAFLAGLVAIQREMVVNPSLSLDATDS